jgi:hypothetical protein
MAENWVDVCDLWALSHLHGPCEQTCLTHLSPHTDFWWCHFLAEMKVQSILGQGDRGVLAINITQRTAPPQGETVFLISRSPADVKMEQNQSKRPQLWQK